MKKREPYNKNISAMSLASRVNEMGVNNFQFNVKRKSDIRKLENLELSCGTCLIYKRNKMT